MNERIEKLITQATTIEEHGWGASFEKFDREKFALLIIQECAKIADTERSNSAGCGYITKTTGMRILEHFQVKD